MNWLSSAFWKLRKCNVKASFSVPPAHTVKKATIHRKVSNKPPLKKKKHALGAFQALSGSCECNQADIIGFTVKNELKLMVINTNGHILPWTGKIIRFSNRHGTRWAKCRRMRSKFRRATGFRDWRQLSQFAAFFIDLGAEGSTVKGV